MGMEYDPEVRRQLSRIADALEALQAHFVPIDPLAPLHFEVPDVKPGREQPRQEFGPDFYSFDECLVALNIDENRLKRLVSEGEIRAFREGDQMKFKRKEIEGLLRPRR